MYCIAISSLGKFRIVLLTQLVNSIPLIQCCPGQWIFVCRSCIDKPCYLTMCCWQTRYVCIPCYIFGDWCHRSIYVTCKGLVYDMHDHLICVYRIYYISSIYKFTLEFLNCVSGLLTSFRWRKPCDRPPWPPDPSATQIHLGPKSTLPDFGLDPPATQLPSGSQLPPITLANLVSSSQSAPSYHLAPNFHLARLLTGSQAMALVIEIVLASVIQNLDQIEVTIKKTLLSDPPSFCAWVCTSPH